MLYLDANNLYGYCMGQKLPHSKFIQMKDPLKLMQFKSKLDKNEKPNIPGRGYIVEVYIKIPSELWEHLDEFPPCPTSRAVGGAELSQVQKEQYQKAYNKPPPDQGQNEKLVADFHTKYHYVVHHEYLSFLLKIGVIILALHIVMTFIEKAFMKGDLLI